MLKKLLITALSTLVIGAIGMSVYNTTANPADKPVTPVDPSSTLAAPASSGDNHSTEVQVSVNSELPYAYPSSATPVNAIIMDIPQGLSPDAIPSDDPTTALSQPSPDQFYDAAGNASQGNGNGNGQGNTGNGKGGGSGGNGNGGGIGRSGNNSGGGEYAVPDL